MNVEIAQRLATLRREQGYSQEELAERLGLSRQAVSKWERAESSPDTGNLVALAKLYGVTLDDLLSIDIDIEDDIKFEAQDKAGSAETKAQAAAEQATAAAEQAAAAANLAAAVAKKTEATSKATEAKTVDVQGAQTQPLPNQGQPYYQAPPPHAAAGATYTSHQTYQQAPPVPDHRHEAEQEKEKKGPWKSFPYPVLCVIVYLFLGFFLFAWHPGWVVFLTIPLYYWIANIIEGDPVYQQNHADRMNNATKKDGE